MDEVEEILQTIALPLQLPEEAFLLSDEHLPDILYLIGELPERLRDHLDLEVTASNKKKDGEIIYRLPLIDGDCLKIRIQDRSIVEVTRVYY
jgi:hypothetical protein